MAPIICPKCGCKNTTAVSDIKSSNDESTIKATQEKALCYYCNSCETNFGGDTTLLEKSTIRIYVNTYKKDTVSQTINFYKTAAGATVEGPFLCYYPDLPELYLDQEQWARFLKSFYALYVFDWKHDYINTDCSHEFGWDLKIKFEDQEPFVSKGSDCYPPYWDALMDLFVSFGLPNIKNKLA
ncbi:hypothetical protein, partial [Acetobacterium bakii]